MLLYLVLHRPGILLLAQHAKQHTFTGGYNPDEYEDLPVSTEVQELFQYILQYKPEVLQLETPLKPFIPDYVPAIGDIDEFIKVCHCCKHRQSAA